ncbi:MAG: type II toxin-antitoxin system RelB/DinJ family antitoxin [Patescibacteria group bacterium]
MASGRIQQRIDPELQRKAEAILKVLGVKPSQAISLFYMEITRQGNLPFHPSNVHPSEIPNKRLAKAIREARRGKGVREFKNKEDFFASLKKS